MFTESSRVAAMFGFLGLAAGALGGAWVDNLLQRDREIEQYLFRLRLEGIQSFLQGQAGFGSDTHDDKDDRVSARSRTNYGRYLIAISGPPDWVRSVRAWMVEEQKRFNNVETCIANDPSFEFYYHMRQALFSGAGGILPHGESDPLTRRLVGEVATRCLFKE